jgi:hypothetical protein
MERQVTLTFEVQPLRFEFKAKEPVRFPPGKAANTLRGALGLVLSQRVFEPKPDSHPSGLADSPRPFVFRARHLDGQTINPGQSFHFEINLFNPGLAQAFIEAFKTMGHKGLGANRTRIEFLQAIRSDPITLNLSPTSNTSKQIRVHFITPIELKHESRIVTRPEFPILFGRIRDRISTLRRLYGAGPLDFDYQASNNRSAAIRMTACDLRREETHRRSSRTGQTHSIGGLIGSADYEGDLAEFLPWLQAAKWTGVGRQCVWGKGETEVEFR